MTVAVVWRFARLFTVNRHCWALNRVATANVLDGWRDCRRRGLFDYLGVYHLLNRHAAVQNFELRRNLPPEMTIVR